MRSDQNDQQPIEAWAPVPKQIAKRIEDMIVRGDLDYGARLASQRDLSADFGVSRASIREALTLLEASGVLKTEPGRGTFVVLESAKRSLAKRDGEACPDLLQGTEYARLDICHFRYVIEGQSARLAAMRVDDAQIAMLEQNLSTFKSQTRAMQLEASAQTDYEFHHLITRISGNRLFADLHLYVRELVMKAVRIPSTQYNRAWEPVFEHERILEAFRRRDPDEARYYMQSHITRSAERLGLLLSNDLL